MSSSSQGPSQISFMAEEKWSHLQHSPRNTSVFPWRMFARALASAVTWAHRRQDEYIYLIPMQILYCLETHQEIPQHPEVVYGSNLAGTKRTQVRIKLWSVFKIHTDHLHRLNWHGFSSTFLNIHSLIHTHTHTCIWNIYGNICKRLIEANLCVTLTLKITFLLLLKILCLVHILA